MILRAPIAVEIVAFLCVWSLPCSCAFQPYLQHLRSLSTALAVSTNMSANMSANSDAPNSSSLKVLGVCGGIGSGKSTASKRLVSDLGCLAHLDADSMAHAVYRPGSQAVKDIAAEFGPRVLLDNTDKEEEIDRKALGAIVFADRNDMAKLERLVWPHVKSMLVEKIESVKSDWNAGKMNMDTDGANDTTFPVVVLEAAVLLDADWIDLLDGIWVVTTPREVALQRLIETRGLSQEDASKRIDAQDSRRGIGNLDEEVRSQVVTRVIENQGSLDELTDTLQGALNDPKSWY